MASVKGAVAETVERMKSELVDEGKLERVKKRLRYGVALGMNESEAVGSVIARYVAMRRSPETMNRLFEQYAALTAEDLRSVAGRYFIEENRISAELGHSA